MQAGLDDEAGRALLLAASRSSTSAEQVEHLREALRLLPPEDRARREAIEALDRALPEAYGATGPWTHTQREALRETAALLEEVGMAEQAASLWERLGRSDDVARALIAAGEVERLEELLEARNRDAARQGGIEALLRDHERMLSVGARIEALDALRQAAALAPEDASLAERVHQLEARLPAPYQVHLRIDGRRLVCLGKLSFTLGRQADIPLRGASISREHARLVLRDHRWRLQDLDSRNGILLRGVPIAKEIEIRDGLEIGLGEDLSFQAHPEVRRIVLKILDGPDRGLEIIAGAGPLRLAAIFATVDFPNARALLTADSGLELSLDGQRCAAPIELLQGDTIGIGGHTIEVVR